MYFQLKYDFEGLLLGSGHAIEVVVHDNRDVVVKIQGPISGSHTKIHKIEPTTSAAYLEQDLSIENEEIFDEILMNHIKDGGINWESFSVYRKSLSGERHNSFEMSLSNIRKELEKATTIVRDAFLWRVHARFPQKSISSGHVYWSKDKISWYISPLTKGPVVTDFYGQFGLSENIKQDIVNLITSKCEAPVHHELFREAREQKGTAPRSSLVIGISALEAAIQTTIRTLAPDTAWLAENTPSPPVVKLLTEYLPTLPAKNKINDIVPAPPEEIISAIRKGVNIRNNIVHKGGNIPANASLKKILCAVHDVIWLLDYYCGYEWAIQWISKETKAKLNI